MPTTYVQRSTNSDLSVPGEYDLQLLEGAVAEVPRTINLAANETKEGYHYTEPGIPGTDGITGDYTVEVNIVVGDNQVQVSAAVARVNSSGAVQTQTAFSTEQTADGTVQTHTFTAANLGTWASGDRLRVAVRYRNSHTKTARSVDVSFNTVNSEVVAPWSAGASPQSEPVVAATESETSQAVTPTGVVTVTVGETSETEAAQAVSIQTLVSISVGEASETDLAQAVTPSQPAGGQTISVTPTTESETAGVIAMARSLVQSRPDADNFRADWDTAPTPGQDLFAQINEETADDNDYIFVEVS